MEIAINSKTKFKGKESNWGYYEGNGNKQRVQVLLLQEKKDFSWQVWLLEKTLHLSSKNSCVVLSGGASSGAS